MFKLLLMILYRNSVITQERICYSINKSTNDMLLIQILSYTDITCIVRIEH